MFSPPGNYLCIASALSSQAAPRTGHVSPAMWPLWETTQQISKPILSSHLTSLWLLYGLCGQNSFFQCLRCSFFSPSISPLLSIRSFLLLDHVFMAATCAQSSYHNLNRVVGFDFLTQQEGTSGSTIGGKTAKQSLFGTSRKDVLLTCSISSPN